MSLEEKPESLIIHEKTVQEVAQTPTPQEAAEAIFRDMLANIGLSLSTAPSSGTWQIIELNIDGKMIPHAILLLAQNNTATATFFSPEDLMNFAQSAMGCAQMIQGMLAKKSNLLIANKDQMNTALAQKREMDSKFGSQRENINWPPEGWKQ